MDISAKGFRDIFFLEEANGMPINPQRIRFILESINKKNYVQTVAAAFEPAKKVERNSLTFKQIGDQHFVSKEYMAALEAYNESLCLAPINSESICSIYASRADIYLDTGFYSFCLENIQLALENNYCSDHLMEKLLEREDICKKRMEVEADSFDLYGTPSELKLSYPANPKIPFMIDGLQCVSSAEFGRQIVTNRDLKPGDIVLIEEPFVKTLDFKSLYAFCYNCGKHNFYNLRPCLKSTTAMFCSATCVDEAWERFYKYESHVIKELFKFDVPVPSFRATLKAFTMVKDLEELKDLIESIDVTVESAFKLDWTKADEREKFRVLYSLATLEDKRSIEFKQHVQVNQAIIFYLIRDQPAFKSLMETEEHENVFLDLWMRFWMISNTNSHGLSTRYVFSETRHRLENIEHGQGIHLLFSAVNHSCCPNVYHFQIGTSLAVMVVRPIKAGEQLFDSYGVHYSIHTLEARKKRLNDYLFECTCEACANKYDCHPPVVESKGFIPEETANEMVEFEEYEFNEKMMEIANRLDKSVPEVLMQNQEHFPSVLLTILEEKLINSKKMLVHKKPFNLILESKNIL